MRKLILLFLFALVLPASAQWGGGLFRFYVSGTTAPKTDSIRVRGGGSTTITLSGNEVVISSTVAAGSVDSTAISNLSVAATDLVNGSVLNAKIANGAITVNKFASSVYPAIRDKVGWTSDGTITGDTVTTRIEWGGTPNTSVKIFDADNDTVLIAPQASKPFQYKDATQVFTDVDTLGRITSGGVYNANGSVSLYGQGPAGGEATVVFTSTDANTQQISSATGDSMQFIGAAGGYHFDTWLTKPDMIEFLGGALQATSASGSSDTTANYAPMEAFSVDDTATFDFSTSVRFTSLDSIVIYAYSNTATSSVVFNCQIRQIQVGGALAGAFNAASSKTIATGTAGTLRQWSFTSFGSVTASVYSEIIGKVYRTTGGTGGDIFVRRVLIYGKGLR